MSVRFLGGRLTFLLTPGVVMIDLKFLRPRLVAGLEFMDFQNTSFFEELVEAIESEITSDNVLNDEPAAMMGIIAKYTGFKNIVLELSDWGNLAIDAGYVNPKNAFNIDGIEKYLTRSESTLGKWFKNNYETFIHGTIDYETGMVGGAYSDLPFTLYINRNLSSFLGIKDLERLKATPAQSIAAALIHELGHAFGGIMMIHQEVKDNIIMRGALHFLTKQNTPQERVVVLKTANELLEASNTIDGKTLESLANEDNPDDYFVYFKKTASSRNTQRALSLGVPAMNSEVIADAYSVRMGCGKALALGMSGLYKSGNRQTFWMALFQSVLSGLLMMVYAGAGLSFGLIVVGVYMLLIGLMVIIGKLSPGIYNTEYRRLLNIQQEMIQKIKSDDKMTSAQKQKLLSDILTVNKVLEQHKSFLEDTAIQRFFLWLTHGSDGKFINIEHYTQLITNNGVDVVSQRLASL